MPSSPGGFPTSRRPSGAALVSRDRSREWLPAPFPSPLMGPPPLPSPGDRPPPPLPPGGQPGPSIGFPNACPGRSCRGHAWFCRRDSTRPQNASGLTPIPPGNGFPAFLPSPLMSTSPAPSFPGSPGIGETGLRDQASARIGGGPIRALSSSPDSASGEIPGNARPKENREGIRRRGRPGSPRSVDGELSRGRGFRSSWPQAFTPGRRTGRGPPIPAPETDAFEELHPCGRCRPPRGGSSSPRRGMPERGPFAFSIPSPLMSASRASCGGRGGRAGAFLQPPTLPPGPSPGVSRRISRETPRIQPPRPDGRLDPGGPAVDSLALRGIPLGNGKDDPGSAGEFPGNTQAENARVGSRTKRPRAKRDPLGSGSQRHCSKPSGSLARLPCPPTFAPASTTANTTDNTTANTTARRGFCPRPFTAPHAAGFGARFPDPGPGGDASHGAARRSPGAPALPSPSAPRP
jgi:hypothetical protein